jgi:predicted nucleotidyltransferase
MATTRQSPFPFPSKRRYRGADIPLRVIRRYARAIAEEFDPDKIILFGSYAYGTPHADSDVDLLVVMPTRNQLDQAFKIRYKLTAPFPMDLIVRTPKEMKWRLEEGESFLTEVVTKGKVLYEKADRRMGAQGRGRSRHRKDDEPKKAPPA